MLVDKCLRKDLGDRLLQECPEYLTTMKVLEKMYSSVVAKAPDSKLDDLLTSDAMHTLEEGVAKICETLSSTSKTSQLWLNYQYMLEVARSLVKADRTGSWDMHLCAISKCLPIFAAAGHFNYLKSAYLYLQDMTMLETTNTAVVSQFRKGLNVVRRTDKYWAGLGCDLVIEQTLMRTLKSNGGLTRGSGMSDEQRIVWTMSLPVSSLYNLAMQDFTDTMYASSEQHKDIAQSRVKRDASDLEKLSSKLRPCSPFAPDPSLRNIFTGVVATKDVNVTRFQELGTRVVQELNGKAAFTCSFKRSLKAKTLAFRSAVKVS